jgi:hypothetical protein
LLGRRANMASDVRKDCFSYETLEDLVKACTSYYHETFRKTAKSPEVYQRREQLGKWIEKFHQDCGTLSSRVKESIEILRSPCIVLMTAHQPNLFAYSGVLRKATLNHVLAERLSKELKLPIVSFFGLADQDFADDRWVKSALLPDVERRGGVLEIRLELPEKIILNRVAKPSRKVLDDWRNEIADWLRRSLHSTNKLSNFPKLKSWDEERTLLKNLDKFWSIVEEAFSKAEVYSDFNAFVMSRIVNNSWSYNTLFARFSECQQIFKSELCMMLSRFEEYSRYLREGTLAAKHTIDGVFEHEYDTIPFWYHCKCGSKARLVAQPRGENLTGIGACLRCGKEYEFDFSSNQPDISNILTDISARSLSAMLMFFEGLHVLCYVGGTGGREYLQQAKYVAERMRMTFPPIVVWRPKDNYKGIGQLAALSTFRDVSGNLDFSEYHTFKRKLERKITLVQGKIEALELQKQQVAKEETDIEKKTSKMKALFAMQDCIRRESNYSLLSRNLKLLENIMAVAGLYPCIIDYAVNIGLEETSKQWIGYLKENGNLLSDVRLQTNNNRSTLSHINATEIRW